MSFTAEQVWGLAVAAQRINGDYYKTPQGRWENDEWVQTHEANKVMVKRWLAAEDFSQLTQADIELGQECRGYFKGFLMRELAGKINDFERQALKIAQMDEFKGNHLLELAVVSCLPSVMERDSKRQEISRDVFASTQLAGAEGDAVSGEITVRSCRYSQQYDRYRITAQLGDAFVDFWFKQECREGDRIRIKGKIKTQRGDKTTQLNFVKKF